MKTNQEWDAEEVKTPEHDEMILYLMNNALEVFAERNTLVFNVVRIDDVKTEVPVKAGYRKDFIVGYIDLVIKFTYIYLFNHKHKREFNDCYDFNDNLVCLLKEGENQQTNQGVAYIEVKPKVTNFGSLIRQINKYRETLGLEAKRNSSIWVVYTKECNKEFVDALKTQNVIVIIQH